MTSDIALAAILGAAAGAATTWMLVRRHLAQSAEATKATEALRASLAERQEESEKRAKLTQEEVRAEARQAALAEIAPEIEAVKNKEFQAFWEVTEAEVDRQILQAMERRTPTIAQQATTVTIPLPNEEMKARLIGRVGRNIKAFEQTTGTDLIIDDTPECVTISCFDPKRRELARLTLLNLILDGRIHPVRIEELHQKSAEILESSLEEVGREAAERAGVKGLSAILCRTLGELRFRASYAQNVLEHSVEVATLAGMIATELGLDAARAKRAALLHDIGKALPSEWGDAHALAGMKFLAHHGERDAEILNAVGAHHHEIEPTSPLSTLVIVSDKISAARPGARRENLVLVLERQEQLEALAKGFRGVKEAYSLQAGRELRVIVVPEEIDDPGAARLANQLVRSIRGLKEYPGPVRVTVIRETRVTEVTG